MHNPPLDANRYTLLFQKYRYSLLHLHSDTDSRLAPMSSLRVVSVPHPKSAFVTLPGAILQAQTLPE